MTKPRNKNQKPCQKQVNTEDNINKFIQSSTEKHNLLTTTKTTFLQFSFEIFLNSILIMKN